MASFFNNSININKGSIINPSTKPIIHWNIYSLWDNFKDELTFHIPFIIIKFEVSRKIIIIVTMEIINTRFKTKLLPKKHSDVLDIVVFFCFSTRKINDFYF